MLTSYAGDGGILLLVKVGYWKGEVIAFVVQFCF